MGRNKDRLSYTRVELFIPSVREVEFGPLGFRYLEVYETPVQLFVSSAGEEQIEVQDRKEVLMLAQSGSS